MRRVVLAGVVVVLALTTVSCGDALDQMGMSPEDREQFEDIMDDVQEAMDDMADGGASGAPDPDAAPAQNDPDWSPDGLPPPPGDPTQSEDQSDEPYCPAGSRCGWASYDGDDGTAARDHYEDLFGRPPDTTESRPSVDDDGNSYEATTTTWDDGDATVTVYSDHHGTDVTVQSSD